jgi:hypothetical protein
VALAPLDPFLLELLLGADAMVMVSIPYSVIRSLCMSTIEGESVESSLSDGEIFLQCTYQVRTRTRTVPYTDGRS